MYGPEENRLGGDPKPIPAGLEAGELAERTRQIEFLSASA